MRFFKGDGPSAQFEAGQQKGGNYFYWVCDIHAMNCHDYVVSSYKNCISLSERQTKVMSSFASTTKSKRQVQNYTPV